MRVLRAIAAAKTRPTRHTASYHGVQWLGTAAEHLVVQTATEPGHEVLRAPRVVGEPMPEVPAELRGWVDASPRSLREPSLKDYGPDGRGGFVDIEERPEQRERFDRWFRLWSTWAEAETARRAKAAVHDELFRIHRAAEDQPESVEVVLSAGLLHLPDPDAGGVHVHLVNQPVDLTRDVTTGDMVVTLTEAPPRLEDDETFTGERYFDGSGGPILRERLDELVSSAVEPAVADFAKEWCDRALTVHCEVSDSWAEPQGRANQLSMSPAIVARPRSGFALRNYFDTIITALEDQTTPVPLGLAQLVEPLENDVRMAWLERSKKISGADLAADPLFPLPANPAQRQIIDRMSGDSGVVVEGPPGTGKTHTIANLVSSLLAQGQRVLVTSEKAQALKVLRDKLPAEMQDLCISMTDASSRGDSDLARSVTTISTAKTSFQPERSERKIADLATRRRRIVEDRHRLLNEIQALRESETVIHPEVAPGFEGTTAAIARALVASSDDGWIADEVPADPPLDRHELEELLRLLRQGSDEHRSRRRQQLPVMAELPSVRRLEQLADTLARGDRAVSGDDGNLVSDIENLPDTELHGLDPASRRAADALAELDRAPGDRSWAKAITDEQLRGQRAHAWERAVAQLPLVAQAIEADRAAENADVRVDLSEAPVPDAASLEAYAVDMEANGPSFWWFKKSEEQKTIESYGERVRVNGVAVASAEAARVAARHLRVIEAAQHLNRAFQPLGASIRPSEYRTDLVDEMATLERTCRAISAVLHSQQEMGRLLAALPAARRPRIDSIGGMERVAGVALAVTDARQARMARLELGTTGDQLEGPAAVRAPEHDELIAAWRAAQPQRYREAAQSLERAHHQQRDQARSDVLLDRLRTAAPRLADELEREPEASLWDVWIPRLPQAWARARAQGWMARHQAPGREHELEQELAVATHDLGQVTATLAAERAWKACLEGMSTREMQALQIYRQQMASVGKGTGKFAEKFRQSAREAMAEAQLAVPAWIMPIRQVLASVPPQQDVFDVVIVDEASQAELTSAFLLWLAPRMIVVGDDKQCTPAEVTQGALAPIFDRLDNELPDLPSHRRMQFTSKSSVFSLLRSCFPQVVRLQEHFRCMPEIIEWSSDEFYADAPLVPLRQFGADRLTPLRATYVPGAQQQGTGQKISNLREAQTIADLVVQCAEDPAYAGKTFGVVVLQGTGQVTLIEDVLRNRLGDEQWEQRRLRVGTPPDFQGDERHVVWLSMVLAPDHRSTALTGEMYRQRFNVAASRAQDQLWLVHSMPADRLGAADMRRVLLEYMTAAQDASLSRMPEGVRRDERFAGFDSLLEQNVFCDLAERGHHVTPQFDINGRRLDLVVTGPGGRMAVECDADTYLMGQEERRAELDREQELKRAGWRFARIRQSSYVLDAAGVLGRLDVELQAAGVAPLLAEGAEPIPVRIVDRAPVDAADEVDGLDTKAAVDEVVATQMAVAPPLTSPSATPPELPVEAPPAPEPHRPDTPTPRPVQSESSPLPSPADPEPAASAVPISGEEVTDEAAEQEAVDQRILAMMAQGESVTRDDVTWELGLTVATTREHLVRLRRAGKLIEFGDRRDPWYRRPTEEPAAGGTATSEEGTATVPPAPEPTKGDLLTDGLTTDEVHALVLQLVTTHGTLSAPDLAEMINVPKMEARGLLTDLSVAGRLHKAGGPLHPVFSLPREVGSTRTTVPGRPAPSRMTKSPQPRPAPAPPPDDFVLSPAGRQAQVRRIANELRNLGAVEPAIDREILDPERGDSILCIAELFWVDGIRGTGGKSIVLELDPEEADLPRLRELNCRVFTSIPELRKTMQAEMGQEGPKGPMRW